MDYTLEHQKLATRVDGIDAKNMLELYIGGIKDEIRHELHILGPMDITIAIKMAKQIEAKNRAMRKIVGAMSIEGRKHVDTQGSQVQRMIARELYEKRVRGLFYKCNNKWSLGHKCAEKKLFIIEDNNEEEDEEILEEEHQEEISNEEEEELIVASMLIMVG